MLVEEREGLLPIAGGDYRAILPLELKADGDRIQDVLIVVGYENLQRAPPQGSVMRRLPLPASWHPPHRSGRPLAPKPETRSRRSACSRPLAYRRGAPRCLRPQQA